MSMNMSSDVSTSAKYFYVDNIYVMSQNLELKTGVLTNNPASTLHIPLNSSLYYHIMIMDPKMQWSLYEIPDGHQIYLTFDNILNVSIGVYMKVECDMFRCLV